eukprot:SAG31_NODE_11040_length_1072_cov_0.950668_1_plen_166_part_00
MDQLSNAGPYAPDESFNLTREVAAAVNFPLIRLFTVGTPPLWKNMSSTTGVGGELAAVTQPWTVASPDALGGVGSPVSPSQRRKGNLSDSTFPREYSHFSAFCWFHGQEIQKARGVSIGLIATSVGGTPAEAWSSPTAMGQCADPPPMPPGPVLPPQVCDIDILI